MTAWKLRRDGETLPKIASRDGITPVLALGDNETIDFSCVSSNSGSTGKICYKPSTRAELARRRVPVTYRDEGVDIDISPSRITRLVFPLHYMARQFPTSMRTERHE